MVLEADDFLGSQLRQLISVGKYTTLVIGHTRDSSGGRLPYVDMLHSSGHGTFTFAFTFSEVSPWSPYLIITDLAGNSTRLLGGYSTFRAPPEMGRVDRVGVYDFDCGERHGDVCNAENAGEPESEEEKDCGKCGDEWGQLLRETECSQGRFTPSTQPAAYRSYGQRCTGLG